MITRLLLPGLMLIAGAAAAPQSPSTPASPSINQSFDAVLEEVEAAQVQLVNGHAEAFKALWSHADEVTLSGGLGGAIAKG